MQATQSRAARSARPAGATRQAGEALTASSAEKKPVGGQLAFRYRNVDTAMGVSRSTAKRLADALGVDETTMIHLAIRQLARATLPQYAADDGPLSAAQIARIKKAAPQGKKQSVRSSLF